MKRLIVIMVAIALGLTTAVSAKKNPEVATVLPTNFKQEIAKHISYPDFARQDLIEGIVTMKITLDNNFNVKIVDLSATNPVLGLYVKNELKDAKINCKAFVPGNVYYMKVRFDLISGF